MFRGHLSLIVCCALSYGVSEGQTNQPTSLKAILDKTETVVSLTANGSPFHAEMKISGLKKEPQYDGSILVDWAAPTKYRIEVQSEKFHQVETVDGDQVQEQNDGDFYPGWLHSFVTALLDPLFVKALLLDPKASLRGSRSSNGGSVSLCAERNDSPGGIRDDVVWSGACFTDDGLLLNAHNFGSRMDFSDHKSFTSKKVARTYSTSAGSYEQITGKITSLRALQTSEIASIRVTQTTPAEKRIGFTLISTKAEEARVDSVKAFDWPSVREGKSEGYMIVRALTDVTGQVRETSKYNSDNPGLEEAGRQAALGYRFKPMLVDGVPAQMEMPLVLHFTSKIADPLPTLRGAELLSQIKGCNAQLISNFPIDASVTPTHISVNEVGKLTGEGYGPQVDAGNPAVVVYLSSDSSPGTSHALGLDCQFAPLTKNGNDYLLSRRPPRGTRKIASPRHLFSSEPQVWSCDRLDIVHCAMIYSAINGSVRIFKTKWLGRFARREEISDGSLRKAIERAEQGLVDADLGGGLIKQRVARPGQGRSGGYRMIVAYRSKDRAVCLYAFAESEQGNIGTDELDALRKLGLNWLNSSPHKIAEALNDGALQELDYEDE